MTEAPAADPVAEPEAEPEAPANPEPEEDPAPRRPPEGTAAADDFGAEDVRGMNAAYVHFHGPVSVDGSAAFGIGGEPSTGFRRATGAIPKAVVDEALGWFTEPPEYRQALAALDTHRLVVLVGADGIGKQTLAFSLLRAACPAGAPLVGVSPAASLSQLAAVKFASRQGYLVADHIGDGTESAVRNFNADRLAEKVAGGPAHLVITTTSARIGQQLKRYAVTVTAPDPDAVLDRCLGDAVLEPRVGQTVRAHIARQRRPQEIVRLARRLVEDQDAAVEAMRDQPREQVAEWFDSEMTKRDLLSVTALAIAGEQTESTHDALVDALARHAQPRPGERAAAPYVAPEAERIGQRRRDHPLLVSVADDRDGGWSDGRRRRFRDPAMRLAVLEALHERYDNQLWTPVRSWVKELCGPEPATTIQVPVAEGLALLARRNFLDVYRTFLDPWADGTVAERTTAAMVLWFMSSL